MFRLIPIFLFLSITSSAQETQKRILFRGDSIWYAGENQLLFSSTDKGTSWDTIFAKRNPPDTVFFQGVFDTATNVFISDQRTLFVFGWDGKMYPGTIVFSSPDGGQTWIKNSVYISGGCVGVKYFHKISPTRFFLEGRGGNCFISDDQGKTWMWRKLMSDKHSSADDRFKFYENGDISYGYTKDCRDGRIVLVSKDGGKSWVKQ